MQFSAISRFHALVILFFLIQFNSYAQIGDYHIGASNTGSGYCSVMKKDAWALFNNIAAISIQTEPAILVGYQHRYSMSAFQTISAGYIHPLRMGTLGVSVFQFGDAMYGENRIGIGYGHQINYVSLGVTVNRQQYHVENFGSTSGYLIELGGLVDIASNLSFGAFISNINQAKIHKNGKERIPTFLKVGFSYQPVQELSLYIQTNKMVDNDATLHVGMEYALVRSLRLRTGISTHPLVNHFGLGFMPKRFQIDYALVNHPSIGPSHQLSIVYKLISIEKKN